MSITLGGGGLTPVGPADEVRHRFILSRPDTYENVEVLVEAETHELAEAKLRSVLPADVRIDDGD